MNGPLDCPFCGNRPTRWYVEEAQPYVVCDNHSEPVRMRLSDWNQRTSMVPPVSLGRCQRLGRCGFMDCICDVEPSRKEKPKMRMSFVWNYRGHNGGFFDKGPNWIQFTLPPSRKWWRCAMIVTKKP